MINLHPPLSKFHSAGQVGRAGVMKAGSHRFCYRRTPPSPLFRGWLGGSAVALSNGICVEIDENSVLRVRHMGIIVLSRRSRVVDIRWQKLFGSCAKPNVEVGYASAQLPPTSFS